ncbi:MAG: polyprenyl synthetase family protein [Bacteroides sp.]|nr:polyprenyl synthetase family protein [Bacteroides sp.]MCM1389236.1 polyprenyl synthetase family protein [Bacteroides sp.]
MNITKKLPDIMHTVNEYVDYINSQISAIKYPSHPAGLYEPVKYTIEAGGKRLRPMLLLAVADALGVPMGMAVNQALAIEMFHNFTLLHDDLMDRADMRHGKPTVHVKWDAATAILSGDTMLTMAGMMVTRGLRDKSALDILALFNDTAIDVYEGQQKDMDFESRTDVTIEEYLDMISQKTGALIAAPCLMGAILANADEDRRQAFNDFGKALGKAFQLQDDWLDTYGDPAVFGKKIGGDILNDKKTYLLIKALADSTGEQKSELLSLMGTRSEEKIERVRAIYDATGAEAACRKLIEEATDEAIKAIERAELSDKATEFFRTLAEKSLTRRS